MEQDANVKVFCRVRPPNERECGVKTTNLSGSAGYFARSNGAAASASFAKKCVTVPASDSAQQTVFLHSKHGPHKTFTFDRVFDEDASQNDIFDVVGAPITQACLEGYNGTIFAYGQTGSGKTFTMQGPDDVIDIETHSLTQEKLSLRGLVPRVFDYLFDNVVTKDKRSKVQHTFACSFLEIYNERVYDLLDGGSAKDAAGLQLRENGRKGVHAEGLIESTVTNSKEAAELMTVGAQNRRVGQTSMNRESSRSHSVFILQLQSKEFTPEGIKIRTSRFNLVDLAGSERQRSTDAAGERLKEAGNINKSLSALGNVILGLSEQSVGKHRHVHYRDSKLTFLLKDSLGGNSKTFMIATISPAEDSAFETLSTLKFAQRAKMIQNSAVVNEDSVGSALFMQEEIQRLRRQLQQAHQEISRNIPGSSLLLQQGATQSDVTSSQDSATPSSQQFGPCDPAVDTRFREWEESFATTAEKNDRLLRSCEFLQLQNGNFQALCADLKQNVAQLKMMLRLRGIGGTGVHEYKPSADAIEWRMKYEEMEERFVELQNKLQRSEIGDAGIAENVNSEVENVNIMLLTLTKQLAFVLREKHDLQDRLLENQAGKDESMEGLSSQEIVDADFSARLEESLKQQANEYQAKLDLAASINACLEEKAAETSLELLQMKEVKALWSVQQHDLERRLADCTAALQNLEDTQSSTKKLLVQEKTGAEKLQVQLDRARESVQLEFEAALADAATANRSLKDSKKLLEHQLTAANEDLRQREFQVQKAENAFAHLKVEMTQLEEVNQRSLLELSEARCELKKSGLQAVHLRAELSERENVIDEQKRSEAVLIEEKSILEQKLEEFSKSIIQLQEDANVTAQHHAQDIESLKCQAQEDEHMLIEDFEEKLRVKDEKFQQLHAEFDAHRANAEEAGRLHNLMLSKKDLSLIVLQQQLDDQKQKFQLALGDVQQKLSETLADLSKLCEDKAKAKVELDCDSKMQEIEGLQDGAKKLQIEKDAMASEIQSLSQRSKELLAKTRELDDQNAELQEQCELQQAQLSNSEDTINRLTQEVKELQQQIVTQSNEVASLHKDLALAQEDCRQAAIAHSRQLDELAFHAKKIEEQQQKVAESKDMANKLEKALSEIRDAKGTVSRQWEENNMYKEIQSTLRDELENVKVDRQKLAEALKTEQESKQSVEKDFAKARKEWMSEKRELEQDSYASQLVLEKRIDELILNEKTLSTLKHTLEQENESLKTSAAEQVRTLQQLKDRVADREDNIIVLESNAANSAATQDKLSGTVAELQNSVRDLEYQLTKQQNILSKQEVKLAEQTTAISERDDTIATLKDRVHNDENTWDLKTREYKAELAAAHGHVQAFEQLLAEKTAAFVKAEESLLTEKYSLEQKLEEGEEILAQQTEQLMQEIKQLGVAVEQKDAQIQLTNESLAEFKDRQGDSSVQVKDLQIAMGELESKHNSVELENASLRKAVSELKKQEDELNRRRSELDVAEEQIKSVRKALEAQKASAENTLKEAKATAVAQDVLGQAKRKFLAEKVKLQREIQTLTKKVERLSKENEKLVGHHNSRQKIQHHVKVKEENNRLLDQVRLLTDDKLKLQHSLEKLRTMLKEKENIVGPTSNTPPSVSPISNASSSGIISTMKVKRPSLGSASSATTGTAARAKRTAARIAARGTSISRSASPGPTKKRARSHLSSSGPGWQR